MEELEEILHKFCKKECPGYRSEMCKLINWCIKHEQPVLDIVKDLKAKK